MVIQNSENTTTTKTDDFVFAEPFGRFYAKNRQKIFDLTWPEATVVAVDPHSHSLASHRLRGLHVATCASVKETVSALSRARGCLHKTSCTLLSNCSSMFLWTRLCLAVAPLIWPVASLLWFPPAPGNLGDLDGLSTSDGVFHMRYNDGACPSVAGVTQCADGPGGEGVCACAHTNNAHAACTACSHAVAAVTVHTGKTRP